MGSRKARKNRKQRLLLRLDANMIQSFKTADTKGYQTRINVALREYGARHGNERCEA